MKTTATASVSRPSGPSYGSTLRSQGLPVVGEYVDDGWSGTNFERPGFQRMMDDVEAGKVNCIVTKDLSALAASTS